MWRVRIQTFLAGGPIRGAASSDALRRVASSAGCTASPIAIVQTLGATVDHVTQLVMDCKVQPLAS